LRPVSARSLFSLLATARSTVAGQKLKSTWHVATARSGGRNARNPRLTFFVQVLGGRAEEEVHRRFASHLCDRFPCGNPACNCSIARSV
jgi:hypothetical protein